MNTKPTDPLRIHAAKQYADKLKHIPSDRWCVGHYTDNYGRQCAAGHLMCETTWAENLKVEKDISEVLGLPVSCVNDAIRRIGGKPIHTPKRNILRRLNQIIKGRA